MSSLRCWLPFFVAVCNLQKLVFPTSVNMKRWWRFHLHFTRLFSAIFDSEVMEAEMMEVIEVEIEEVIDTPINEFNMEAILRQWKAWRKFLRGKSVVMTCVCLCIYFASILCMWCMRSNSSIAG